MPLGAPHVVMDNGLGTLLHEEALDNVGDWLMGEVSPIQQKQYPTLPPQPDAEQLARAIRTRFTVTRGALEVMAPRSHRPP